MTTTEDTMTALRSMLSKEGSGWSKDYKSGHEAATNRLIGLLEKAVDMAEFYASESNWFRLYGGKNNEDEIYLEIYDGDMVESRINDAKCGGKKAREFLAELETLKDQK